MRCSALDEKRTEDGDAIRELLNVLPGGAKGQRLVLSHGKRHSLETVEMVQIRHGREELVGTSHPT